MYEKTANRQLGELRVLQRIALQGGLRDTPALRDSIAAYEKDLEDGLRGILTVRGELHDSRQENEFDSIIDPIRQQIKTLLNVTRSLPAVNLPGSNPFEQATEDDNPYEMESRRYLRETTLKDNELRQLADDMKERAEATVKIEKDMADLEKIFQELGRIVHEQHDVVDSIEEQVERATEDVKRGNENLKKAVKSKAAKAPLYAGVVGGLAVGGPVGLAAGSAIAGIAAGVGGLVATIYTGKFFKRSATSD
ncbi:t-SNARE coiled-coil homology domain-containing protein [Caenorhabditis elegans]|uniref:t-SNARE coiled-coil homology domain-containing protein n=1 Tax=Caenorhabditis elegans TaxID=6239 RepID=O62387_CAEEL|nr:t-SNARE coiled-coil homology domain-containing protein [Caenorhabditis elegans]CAB10725.1 t-SNARE coiled-coil homology domain-containing protein [Caenorhabditis elegans]|eukprot:NP_492342.1 SYntaXin [Caenorhabditis elegans]